MRNHILNGLVLWLAIVHISRAVEAPPVLDLAGVNLTPHLQSKVMRYRSPPDFELGMLAQLFLRNSGSMPLVLDESTSVHFRENTPSELVKLGQWAWHDTPGAWAGQSLRLPPGALTVWTFNSRGSNWGLGTTATLQLGPTNESAPGKIDMSFAEPKTWLSAITFLGPTNSVSPDSLVFHIVNSADQELRVESCRLWLPASNQSWRALLPGKWLVELDCFPADGIIPAGGRGGARIRTGPLPLTYVAIEVRVSDSTGKVLTLWAHLRIKREVFDISGGWVGSKLGRSNTLQCVPYLKTLRRMHINTAHIADITGYTDQDGPGGLYAQYPLKYFNKLQPFDRYDTDAMLPRIHAVEFLGEPQYGGGRPVPPQEVWQALAPYLPSRLPTTITHSEERIWRYYAGLSDFPHYDAYRVTAPSPDAWSKYERWNGQSLRWGRAPRDHRRHDSLLAGTQSSAAHRLLVARRPRRLGHLRRTQTHLAHTRRTAPASLPCPRQPHYLALLVQSQFEIAGEIPRPHRADYPGWP